MAASNVVTVTGNYTLLKASTEKGVLDQHIGENLFDVLPRGVAGELLPLCRNAWDHLFSDYLFVDGELLEVSAHAGGGVLTLEWKVLAAVDVTSLETLETSCREIAAILRQGRAKTTPKKRRAKPSAQPLALVPSPSLAT
jgi:hypothetical protein